ncbi:MAG: hypothetical protein AAF525_17565, partial [Pseudomonadota bacterium]
MVNIPPESSDEIPSESPGSNASELTGLSDLGLSLDSPLPGTPLGALALPGQPVAQLPDASFLSGDFSRDGFDLVIRSASGEVFVVEDYFGMVPPPFLLVGEGIG